MTTADAATPRWYKTPEAHRAARGTLAAIPVVLVNAVAFIGQYGFLRQHLPWIVPGVVMFAVALESIAIYLAWHAHMAQLANDSSARLRLASYSIALVIGAMNYSHYMRPDGAPTVAAVGLGLMSAISPWLWGIHSRRASRDKLMERGLIEEHAVRLGATRWSWHPWLSFKAMRGATWTGETSPATVIASVETKFGDFVPSRRDAGTLPVAHPDQRAIESPPGDVPAADVPAVPGPDVPDDVPDDVPAPGAPEQTVPAVPVVPAQATAPEIQHLLDLAERERAGSEQQETERDPGVTVNLSADASLPARSKRPPLEAITAAELKLAGTPSDRLPSVREVARDMLGDPNQRRLADKLLTARRAAGATWSGPPAGETVQGVSARREARPDQPQAIATPANHRIGGQAVG